MKFSLRHIRRFFEKQKHKPKMLEIESILSDELGRDLKLIPASAKGGYDEIYHAIKNGERFAVVRINNAFKEQKSRPLNTPNRSLSPPERIDCEWDAYQKLYPAGISPKPLWRNNQAIACEWIDAQRLSKHLVNIKEDAYWRILEKVFYSLKIMHDHGIVHMDMNLGNMLIMPDKERVMIIDFEYSSAEWLSETQQKVYDYLRVIDDLTRSRRGGKMMLKEIDRFISLVSNMMDDKLKTASMAKTLSSLKKLAQQPELMRALNKVLPNLLSEG